jgi:hypothetical protein
VSGIRSRKQLNQVGCAYLMEEEGASAVRSSYENLDGNLRPPQPKAPSTSVSLSALASFANVDSRVIM